MPAHNKWDYWAEVGVAAEFSRMREEAKFTDVSIVCEDNVAVAAHRSILECHSGMLHVVMAAATPSPASDCVLMLPDVSATTVRHLLALLYTGRVVIPSKLEVRDLRQLCQQLQILVPDGVFRDSGVFKTSGEKTSYSEMARAKNQAKPTIPDAAVAAMKRRMASSDPIGGSEPKAVRLIAPTNTTALHNDATNTTALHKCTECDMVFPFTIALQNHMQKHRQQNSSENSLTKEEVDPLSTNEEPQNDDHQYAHPVPARGIKEEAEDDEGFDPTLYMQQSLIDEDDRSGPPMLNYGNDPPRMSHGIIINCPTCDREYLRTKIREHIVASHHIPTLRRLYVSADGQCAFCPKKGTPTLIARHVGLFHNKIEELGTPEELAVLPTRRKDHPSLSDPINVD